MGWRSGASCCMVGERSPKLEEEVEEGEEIGDGGAKERVKMEG